MEPVQNAPGVPVWEAAVSETVSRQRAPTPASDGDHAGARESILFVASVDSHIWAFHMPYMQLLRDMGYEVEVAAAPAGSAEKIRAEGYEVHSIPFSRNPLSLRNIAAYRSLRGVMQNRHYVMVHVHTPVAGFLGRLAALRMGVPHVVYTAHGFHFHRHGKWWSNRLYYFLERVAARWTDTLITINREDFAVASRNFTRGRTQVVYIPGVGTDCSRYAPASACQRERGRTLLGFREDAVVVAWVAEFIKRKRPGDAVTTVHELSTESVVQLVMLGSGPLLTSIRALVQQRCMCETVAIPGHVPDVSAYLAASDVFLSTASQEGLPRNVMEAMATGLPVVAYDIRGCNDLVVDGETGYLVPLGDMHGLTDRLAWLAQHPLERHTMGTAGRRRIEEAFSLEVVLPQMKTVYRNELERGCS
jgi:glycosyltransferase involved in cell wall biosynthesis